MRRDEKLKLICIRRGRIWSQWTKAWLTPPQPLSQLLLGLLEGEPLHPDPDPDYTDHADQLLILMMLITPIGRGGGGCQGLQTGVPLSHQQLTQHNPTTMVSRRTQFQNIHKNDIQCPAWAQSWKVTFLETCQLCTCKTSF